MPLPRALLLMLAAATAGLAACSKPGPADNATSPVAATATATPPAALAAPSVVVQNSTDPLAFAPLQSVAVKDAIHRALSTGQTQRWQDGALSGYAVPSQTTGQNGCRSVRYTVDQRPAGQFETITACDASR